MSLSFFPSDITTIYHSALGKEVPLLGTRSRRLYQGLHSFSEAEIDKYPKRREHLFNAVCSTWS